VPDRPTSSRLPSALGIVVLVAALIALPHLLSLSQKEVLVLLVINVLLVSSYRLLTLTGEWSLAHVVIMGVGAYGSALVAKELGWPVPLSMLAGSLIAALLAYLLSFPLFRMKGFYFLIGSFAAGEVIRLIWKWSELTWLFGGPKGIKLIPPFPDIEALSVDFYDPVNYYYLCLIVVALSLLVLYRVERSRIGLTFHAIHWQDKLAESVGVQTFRYRTLAFVISAFFAGLSGALYAHYVGTVNPNRFSVEEMTYVLIWAIVGGTATFYGPIFGVVVLTILNEVVLRALGVDEMRPMLYGAILILFILFLPNGLESVVPKIKDWFAGRKQRRAKVEQPAEAKQPASAELPAK
jgi:branched-chain amino acid transport system permease protein